MFILCVVLAGHDAFTDTGRTSTCKCKFKAPSLQTKSTKNEGHSENKGFNGEKIEDFRRKNEQEHYSRPFKKTQWNTRTLKASLEQGLRKQ